MVLMALMLGSMFRRTIPWMRPWHRYRASATRAPSTALRTTEAPPTMRPALRPHRMSERPSGRRYRSSVNPTQPVENF